MWGERKKTYYPFSIKRIRSDQGVQKYCWAVKNLFTTLCTLSVNLIIWWLISWENTTWFCPHLASNRVVNASVSSNFKAVFSFVSLCNVMFCGGSKMSGSTVEVLRQSLCLLPQREHQKSWALLMICFKTQFGNFKSGWISSENIFVALTTKD